MSLLPWKQDKHNRTSSLSSVTKLRSLIKGRKSDERKASNNTYRDINTTQNFIGQCPTTTHRPSSRTTVLAWRSQVASHTNDTIRRKTSQQLENIQKKKSGSLPILNAFQVSTDSERYLREQPSMSFPHHLRCRSQPISTLLAQNSVLFPSMDEKVVRQRQPWWDSDSPLHVIGKDTFDQEPCKENSGLEVVNPIDTMTRVERSSTTISTRQRDHIAAEAQTLSEASFTTCHSSPIIPASSKGGSTPTLCQSEDAGEDFGKDTCQSPFCDDFTFTPRPPLYDEFPDQSCSFEVSRDLPVGFGIEEVQVRLRECVELNQDGRQPPLSSLDATALEPAQLHQSKPAMQKHLSLSDFLHGSDEGCDPAKFDESFESGSFDDEEDAAQICHAWRETIAFAGLGASLANGPIPGKGDYSIDKLQTRNSPLRHRASKVSMQAIDLDTIQEASFDSRFTSTDDSLDGVDICAHLLRRAVEEKVMSTKA
jgi:hypothetical protein